MFVTARGMMEGGECCCSEVPASSGCWDGWAVRADAGCGVPQALAIPGGRLSLLCLCG